MILSEGLSFGAWSAYNAHGKRDPFVPLLTINGQRIYPPGTDEGGTSGFVLQGIVYEPKGVSYAIINDQIVREQDQIEGMKVLKISPQSVTILSDGNEAQLVIHSSLPEEEAGQ